MRLIGFCLICLASTINYVFAQEDIECGNDYNLMKRLLPDKAVTVLMSSELTEIGTEVVKFSENFNLSFAMGQYEQNHMTYLTAGLSFRKELAPFMTTRTNVSAGINAQGLILMKVGSNLLIAFGADEKYIRMDLELINNYSSVLIRANQQFQLLKLNEDFSLGMATRLIGNKPDQTIFSFPCATVDYRDHGLFNNTLIVNMWVGPSQRISFDGRYSVTAGLSVSSIF